jgi:hypothetical protein
LTFQFASKLQSKSPSKFQSTPKSQFQHLHQHHVLLQPHVAELSMTVVVAADAVQLAVAADVARLL